MTKFEKGYVILVSFFCLVLAMTNLVGMKFIQAPFSSLALTSGIITYPFTFILGAVVTEIYGKQRANFMVYLSFIFSVLMFLIVRIIIALPAHPYWVSRGNTYGYEDVQDYQYAFEATFSVTNILIISSLLAFMASQLLDVYLFQKIRELTRGKHLWLRNVGSTLSSQLVDTIIVNVIVLYFGLKMHFLEGLEVISSIYLYKFLLSIMSIPVTYLIVFFVKRLSRKDKPSLSIDSAF